MRWLIMLLIRYNCLINMNSKNLQEVKYWWWNVRSSLEIYNFYPRYTRDELPRVWRSNPSENWTVVRCLALARRVPTKTCKCWRFRDETTIRTSLDDESRPQKSCRLNLTYIFKNRSVIILPYSVIGCGCGVEMRTVSSRYRWSY